MIMIMIIIIIIIILLLLLLLLLIIIIIMIRGAWGATAKDALEQMYYAIICYTMLYYDIFC